MSNRYLIYILAEDKHHQTFIRGFLKKIGIGAREMIFAPISGGHGSGKWSVLNQFSDQVRLCRRRNSYATTSLIAMMDADELSVDRCLTDLDGKLTESGQERADRQRDRIARLIPKRNVETWILFLSAKAATASGVDEEQDYKQTKAPEEWSVLIPNAAATLFEWTRPGAALPANLIESLQRGIQEIPRALPAGR